MDLGSRTDHPLRHREGTVGSQQQGQYEHTPGAYPLDADTPINESGPDVNDSGIFKPKHNKLHKPNDPRGWTEDEQRAAQTYGAKDSVGHRHTDSGVGMVHDHDTSPTRQPDTVQQQPRMENESDNHTKPNTLPGTLAGAIPLSPRQPTDRHTASEETGPQTTSTDTAGANNPDSDRDYSHDARPTSEVKQEHPYWGDLPRGAGVYNTVTGHGSEEDQKQRQHDIYRQETRTSAGQDSQQPIAGLSDGSRMRQNSPQATSGTTGYRQQESSQYDNNKDLGNRHEYMGAGGAATATAAAATAYQMHERDNTTTEGAQKVAPAGENKESHGFGLFHHSKAGDEHKETARHEKEKRHHEKDEISHRHDNKPEKKSVLGGLFQSSSASEDKHNKQADRDAKENIHHSHDNKPEKKSVLGGLFHSSSASEDRHDEQAHRDVKEKVHHSHDNKHESKPVLGGLFHSSGASEDKHNEQADRDVKDNRHIDQHDKPNSGAYTAAGLGAGGLFHHTGASEDKHNQQADRGMKDSKHIGHRDNSNSGAYTAAGMGAGGLTHRNIASEDNYNQHANRGVNDTRYNGQHDNSNSDAYTAAGLGAGAAAGGVGAYMASRSHRDGNERDNKDTSVLGQTHHRERTDNISGYTENLPQRGYEDIARTYERPGEGQMRDNHDYNTISAGALGTGAAATGLGAGMMPSYEQRTSGFAEQTRDPHQFRSSQSSSVYQDDNYQPSRSQISPAVAATGLGGGMMPSHEQKASRYGDQTQDSHQFGSSQARSAYQDDNYQQSTSQIPPAVAATGLGGGMMPSHEQETSRFGDQDDNHHQSTSQTPPAVTEHANHGEYNFLSSGTPSGVRTDTSNDASRK